MYTQNFLSMIPATRICPLCLGYKPRDGQWASAEAGDAVCRSCLHQFPELSAANGELPSPEHCLSCMTELRLQAVCRRVRFRVAAKPAWVCSRCDMMELEVGSYRVDVQAREFKLKAGGMARYAFGSAKAPVNSWPSRRQRFTDQVRKMWAVVTTRLQLPGEVAARFAQRESDLWWELSQGPCLDALLRSAVSLMYSVDVTKGRFESYACSSMSRAAARYLRLQRRNDEGKLPLEVVDAECINELRTRHGEEALGGLTAPQLLEEVRSRLRPDEVSILERLFIKGMTFEEVGIEEGVVRSAIHNQFTRLRARLLEELGDQARWTLE